MSRGNMTLEQPTTAQKIGAALFYAISSLAIMFVNKTVLSVYGFPSFTFLAASQAAFTVVVLRTLHLVGKVKISPANGKTFRIMAPLVLISFINVTSGLAGTKKVNMPMFTVLRRFAIPITMALERILLHVTPSPVVQFSVFLMILGTIVAALNDLTFDLQGYVAIMLSNLFTSLNGVVMKKTMQGSDMTSISLLYHISWASMFLMLGLVWSNQEEVAALRTFEFWQNPNFILSFLIASAMGSVLNYSIFLCTAINSALATCVVGCLKNVLSTYLGMVLFSDYIFSWANFLGLNISIVGSLVYGYAEITLKQQKQVKDTPGTSPRPTPRKNDEMNKPVAEEIKYLLRTSISAEEDVA